MKRAIEIILMILGVLFLVELVALGWFYVADPLRMFSAAPAATSSQAVSEEVGGNASSVTPDTTTVAPAASPAQVEAAASAGVTIPTFTDEQIGCFEGIFGAARVQEIKSGAVPTTAEMYQGRSCL
jgi:hypothetical protein